MKKLFTALVATASLLSAAPAQAFGPAMQWQNNFFCEDKPQTQARCYKGEGPSTPALYEQLKTQGQSGHFESGWGSMDPRDTPPSDRYMYENAQMTNTDFGSETRLYITDSGDAYNCDPSLCRHESAFSLNRMFEVTYRTNALKFNLLERFNDKCVLVGYRVSSEKISKSILFFATPGTTCSF